MKISIVLLLCSSFVVVQVHSAKINRDEVMSILDAKRSMKKEIVSDTEAGRKEAELSEAKMEADKSLIETATIQEADLTAKNAELTLEREASRTFSAGCSYSQGSRMADCPSGYSNTGLTCLRGHTSYGKSCCTVYGGCGCKSGYTDMGCHCAIHAHTLWGVHHMSCKAGEFRTGGRCYKYCKSGYSNDGEVCTDWNCVNNGWRSYVVKPIGGGLLATLCGTSKLINRAVGNDEEVAKAEQCIAFAEKGCGTDIGTCNAVIACIVTQLAENDPQITACASAVAHSASLVTTMIKPGPGWLTIGNTLQCIAENTAKCAGSPAGL